MKWTFFRPPSGSRIRSQYKKQPHTIRVTAYRNGTRDGGLRIAAPNIKMLLEYCTEKLSFGFAARRVFLEDGVEVFDEQDIPLDADVYISLGENYKDPYAAAKRNIIQSNGAKWTLTGVMLPVEGKKKVSVPRLSKRMKKLSEKKRVRVVVYRNGKSTEPVEIVADLSKKEEFLVACTAKLDLQSHARIIYEWEGNVCEDLADIPVLDECLQSGGTDVLGPVWISTGEGFSPFATRDFLISVIEELKRRRKEAKKFKKELNYKREGEEEKIKIAVKILSMSKKEVEEAYEMTEKDLDQLTASIERLQEKVDALGEAAETEKSEGAKYRMNHISELPEDKVEKYVGQPGLRLKVNENGTADNPQDLYFNIREANRGIVHDKNYKELLLKRLLDELSKTSLTANSKNPKLAPNAKKIFDEFGHEINDVNKLKPEQEIWVSFGEPYICPFSYCLQVAFDQCAGIDFFGERKVLFREQFNPEIIKNDAEDHSLWSAIEGFPEDCYESSKGLQKDQVQEKLDKFELDPSGHFLQYKGQKASLILYPELVVNYKLPRKEKSLWPRDSQIFVISKGGYIYFKPTSQLCLAASNMQIKARLNGHDNEVEGFVITVQKKMPDNPNQQWQFHSDATISSKAHPELRLTYLGNKFGEDASECFIDRHDLKPGIGIYFILTNPLEEKKIKSFQRFALKQERLDKPRQWTKTETSNPEWNKLAYSWPVREDESLNMDYDWPMEGYLVPQAPKLWKAAKKSTETSIRLMVLKNGEQDRRFACPIVGPNLANMTKDLKKDKNEKRKSRQKLQKTASQDDADEGMEDDINIYSRERDFIMFLGQCTAMLNLPFAARRLFDEKGDEKFSLLDLRRDQLVYVSCGEAWCDPSLSKTEQHRYKVLSDLTRDVTKIRQFVALRNPEFFVLEIYGNLAYNTPIIVNKVWDLQQQADDAIPSEGSLLHQLAGSQKEDEEPDTFEQSMPQSAHEVAHQRAEQRLNKLKWPWEKLVNVSQSFDEDPEAQKYTDRDMYEKYKPKPVVQVSQEQLQRFVYEDGYIACAANKKLVLGALETEGRVIEVRLVKRRPDDMYQLWYMKENGEIRLRHNPNVVLTVSMPSCEPYTEDEEPLTFAGCKVTLQGRKNHQYGKAHQLWRYDAETGYIHAFNTDLPDKEITAANKADVCTYSIANNSKIDQPGYIAEIPLTTATDKGAIRRFHVCISCAKAMRGRYKLNKLPSNVEFSCAMGNAKKYDLPQIGSFRIVNGKVDLSEHEYELTLNEWEDKLAKLHEETSVRVITKEINAARTVRTVKVLAYKNGEGRMRPGEIICGSSVEGILNQASHRLSLNKAARTMYTEDGTVIFEIDNLIDWAFQEYRNLMADHLEKTVHSNGSHFEQDEPSQEGGRNQRGSPIQHLRGEGEGRDSPTDTQESPGRAEVDEKEGDKLSKQREFLLSQIQMPSLETILRYPIEVWVSSGKPFVPPEVVESKTENRKKKRNFRAAISLELDMEKHILRQMKGRRLEELNPGELKGTMNTVQPVIIEGHWQEPTPDEQKKHDTVHKLETHYAEVRANQKEKTTVAIVDSNKPLYKQPNMKRVQVYPMGESLVRTEYVWGETLDQILDNTTIRLNLWQRAKRLYTEQGKEITKFEDVERDMVLCVSMGKPFQPADAHRQNIEVKANYSRAHKQYGQTATEVTVDAAKNPKVNVDPFGPPALALPPSESRKPITDKPKT
ncbi:hypothetical protein ACJMK2_019650 [Sinanodonta woodiana]|uniref:Doublecortin domain-containing protein n=1 Tax=Sinanodonta woodiana TaxID=1069815 RepID=A0ABD3TYA8_SINWO